MSRDANADGEAGKTCAQRPSALRPRRCFSKTHQRFLASISGSFLTPKVVELKSVSQLTPEHEAQLLNYMRLVRHPVGYLINFGPIGKLEWKRFVLKEFVGENR
jgi:hypothetical protein